MYQSHFGLFYVVGKSHTVVTDINEANFCKNKRISDKNLILIIESVLTRDSAASNMIYMPK